MGDASLWFSVQFCTSGHICTYSKTGKRETIRQVCKYLNFVEESFILAHNSLILLRLYNSRFISVCPILERGEVGKSRVSRLAWGLLLEMVKEDTEMDKIMALIGTRTEVAWPDVTSYNLSGWVIIESHYQYALLEKVR